ncbi:MAG: NAD(P)H-dependent oxidoreductase [Lachnospiraceae bacterium]|nr:NAD(P)H-dependent oxidoreductase [Lachnospiraceae bacterium]
MVLFVNACVRKDSRTRRLADRLLSILDQPVTEVRLADYPFPSVNEEYLQKRDSLIEKGAFDDPMFALARQFSEADTIVIAAPFWDMSFPAALKQYFEIVNVIGLTFRYRPDGTPEGLCKAERLYYITTAGGNYLPESYGFGYVKELTGSFYGIKEVELVKAAGLDIVGADVEGILRSCEEDMVQRLSKDK